MRILQATVESNMIANQLNAIFHANYPKPEANYLTIFMIHLVIFGAGLNRLAR